MGLGEVQEEVQSVMSVVTDSIGMTERIQRRKDVKIEAVVSQHGISSVLPQVDVKQLFISEKPLGVSAHPHERGTMTKRRGKGRKNVFEC